MDFRPDSVSLVFVLAQAGRTHTLSLIVMHGAGGDKVSYLFKGGFPAATSFDESSSRFCWA
jgi:hypothetical protein